MSEIKYPKTAFIARQHPRTKIEYNGIKLFIRKVAYERLGHIFEAHSVMFTKLHYNPFNGDKHVTRISLEEKQVRRLKRLNLEQDSHRKYLIRTIREHASWFTQETEGKLENIIIKALNPDWLPANIDRDQNNRSNYTEEQERKYFRDVWKLALRLNISPEEAKERLRTGNY